VFGIGPSARTSVAFIGFCTVWLAWTEGVAGVANFCVGGPCLPDHETVINLYWDTSTTQWDSDVGGASTGETVAQLDTFTRAIVHSSYFSQLSQYGVNHIYMGPTLTAADCTATPSAATLPANVDAAIHGIDALLRCITQTNATLMTVDTAIVNVFLPPQVTNTGFCNALPNGTHAAAEHDASSNSRLAWTVIPTTAACNSGANAVTTSLTHEIVEAATDPVPQSPTGWKEVGGREIADFCGTSTPYAFASATQYWSNRAQACVNGFGTTTAPAITSTTVCGTGRNMAITLRGSFGPPPWDLVNGGPSLYVNAALARPGVAPWKAGNILAAPPDTVRFGRLDWTQGTGPHGADEIKIRGFAGTYGTGGQVVRPGDTITISVENPDNGLRTTTMVTAPSGSAIRAFSVAPDLMPKASSGVSGVLMDSGGCGVENTSLQLTAAAGTITPATVTTGIDGAFVGTFTAPAVAGAVSLNVQNPTAVVTTRVHPRIDALVQPRGGVAGGVSLIVRGLGFDNSTVVTFGGHPGALGGVTTDHLSAKVITPASSSGTGAVTVAANVNGIDSSPVRYDYILPGVPILEFIDTAGAPVTSHTCSIGHIRASVFDADGTPRQANVRLSATYPAFRSAGIWIQSLVVAVGDIVTISGGGPIKAVDVADPTSTSTTSFPVWPVELCDAVKSVDEKVKSMILAAGMQLQAFVSKCQGDCGSTKAPAVIWGDAERLNEARNYVSIRGASAGAIQARYKVEAVANESRLRLITDNPFAVIQSKTAGRVAFVGAMMTISGTVAAESKASAVSAVHLSFALPDRAGVYGIVHLRPTGERHAWVEVKTATVTYNRAAVEADVSADGVYALVRVVGTKQK